MATRHPVRLKRIYDEPAATDGYRVLVDRVWPRGMTFDRARADEWLQEVAPSTQLRTWYGHQPERFEEFARRYSAELTTGEPAAALDHLRGLMRDSGRTGLTLLTSTKRYDISQAAVLLQILNATETSRTPEVAAEALRDFNTPATAQHPRQPGPGPQAAERRGPPDAPHAGQRT